MHNSNNITQGTRGIATILLLSQLLTSCGGFKETLIVPSKPAPIREVYAEPTKADYSSKEFRNTANDAPLAFDTTTIAGTPLTFTYTPSLSTPSLPGVANPPSLLGAFPLCHCEEPQATKQTMASATHALCVDYLRIRKGLRLDEPFGVGFAPRHCESRRGVAIAMTGGKKSLLGAFPLRHCAEPQATMTRCHIPTVAYKSPISQKATTPNLRP